MTTAVLTGLFALAGATLGALGAASQQRRDHRWQAARDLRARRTDAFADLLLGLDKVRGAFYGSLSMRHKLDELSMPDDLADTLQAAATRAEMLATPEVWAEMIPYFTLATAMLNYPRTKPPIRDQYQRILEHHDAGNPLSVQRVREQFIAAAKTGIDG